MQNRNLYKFIAEVLINENEKKDELLSDAIDYFKKQSFFYFFCLFIFYVEFCDKIILIAVRFNFAMNHQNPLENVLFYNHPNGKKMFFF